MTTFVTKQFVHMNRSGSDQSTLDAREAYITGTFRVGGDITLGDESTDLIHTTGSVRVSGTLDVGEVGPLPLEVGFFVSGSRGARGQSINPAVALCGGDVHESTSAGTAQRRWSCQRRHTIDCSLFAFAAIA